LRPFCFPWRIPWGGSDSLDIQAALSRPGVKLVVVEFYATWCKPCMAAVPEWKALHRKYKKAGLRFIVVSADEGVCSKPPEWSPDETLCDANGVLQRKFEVSDLPTSLLFSWEGNVAMRSHRVKPVEDAIESYFRDTTYKIEVDEPEVFGDKYAIGSNPDWVRDDVVTHLRQRSKFDVVTAAGRRIARQQSDVCSASFPPNSVLRIKLTGDETGERYLSLQLEKDGCVKASAQAVYRGEGFREDKASLRKAVKTAVDQILAQIITVRAPEDADSGVRVQTFRNKFDDDGSGISNPVVDQQGYLAVESEPEGATVYVNGEEMGTTPFVKELMVGEYVVLVKSGALWIPAKKRVKLTQDGARLQMSLGPNFGILKVESNPSGAEIWLDGEPTSFTTPYTFPMKKAGDYSLVLKKQMYLSRTIPVQLGEGKTVTVSERLEPNFGSIKVTSTPSGASVYIDGRDSGETTPATISPVSVGGREVVVRLASHNDYKKLVNVERGRTASVEAVLTGKMGLLKVEAFVEKDGRQRPVLGAKVFIDGAEVGQTPFKKQVLVGSYKVAVRSDDGGYEGDATVEEGQEKRIKAVLRALGGTMAGGAVWKDAQSGLMWQAMPPSDGMNWNDAKAYCSNLSLGGYSDWRLPSIMELRSLIRGCSKTEKGGSCNIGSGCRKWSCRAESCNGCSRKGGPGESGHYWPKELPDVDKWCFWSSSPVGDSDSLAWGVFFGSGYVDSHRVTSATAMSGV